MEQYSYLACRNLWLAQQAKAANVAIITAQQGKAMNDEPYSEYPDIDKDYTPTVREILKEKCYFEYVATSGAQEYIDKLQDARMKKLCQDLHDRMLISILESLDPTPKVFPEPFRFLDGLRDRDHE